MYRIQFDSEKGRGLYANEHIKKGSIILEEEPLVSCQFAWNKSYGYLACDHCLRPLENVEQNVKRLLCDPKFILLFPELNMNQNIDIVKCENCDESYCSQFCKNIAFNLYHKLLCINKDTNHPLNDMLQVWKESHYPPETCNIMLLARIIAFYELSSNPDVILRTLNNFVHETVNNSENTTISHKVLGLEFREKLSFFRNMLSQHFTSVKCQQFWNDETFHKLFVLLSRNGQAIGTSPLKIWIDNCKSVMDSSQLNDFQKYLDELYEKLDNVSGTFLNNEGSGLFVAQSLCNHSCEPNAECQFPKNNFILNLVAIQDIQKDEEILISYLDECALERSRHSRQKALMEYLFICKCEKCLRESSQPDVTSDEDEDNDSESCDNDLEME